MSEFKTPDNIVIPVGTEAAPAPVQPKSDIPHILEHSNIPKRYVDAKFEAKNEDQEKLVAAIRKNVSGKGLSSISDMLIMGSVGNGKTHISIGALNALMHKGTYCRYVTEYDLLELYFRKEYTKFDGFKQVPFLVIDEVGKRELVDWQLIQLEELISYRYNEMLPTIFITNRTMSEFKDFVGDRVVDRLRDNNVVTVTMTGDSLRGSDKNK